MALMRVIMTYQPYMLAHMIEPLKLLYDFLVRALHLQERVALQRTLALLVRSL